MMISRRNFLKGLVSAAASVGILPYLPKEMTSIKSVNLQAETVRPFTAGERIWAGNPVYVGTDGRCYNVPGYSIVGIALNSAKKNEPLFVATHGVVHVNMIAPDKPYYLKGEG